MLFTSTPAVSTVVPAWIKERLAYFADPRFTFDPEPHEYRLGDRLMTSCTTWLKQYTEPFISEERAPASAAKAGCTVEEILAKWEHNRWVGTVTHEHIEHHNNFRMMLGAAPRINADSEVQLRFKKYLALDAKRLHVFEPVGQEVRLFHEELGLCGTLDYLGWHTKTKELYVLDWKCTGTIGNDDDSKYRRMKGPFADLWDHKHNVYSLQISLYRLFLEAQFIPTAGGAICWLPGGDRPAEVIPALDYRERLRKLLF